jgi:PIN domain nuclease of toxin-antitoxin system
MILLDTHVVVWLMTAPDRISKAAAEAIAVAGVKGERPAVSSATVFEIAYGASRGRIRLNVTGKAYLDRLRGSFILLPMTEEIALRAATLEDPFHGDPMDRIIVATAIVEDCVLLTVDGRIRGAGVCKTLW